MVKYHFGDFNHVVKLSSDLSYWDDCLECVFLRCDPEYFDDAVAWTASLHNSRSWRGIFDEDVDKYLRQAVTLAARRGETSGLQPSQDERRCALFSPKTRPNTLNARQRAINITRDFAKLSDHYPWVHNIRVTQFTYLSKPDANAEIVNGFVEAISEISRSAHRLRWLVDLQRHNIPFFDKIIREAGGRPVEPSADQEAIAGLIAVVRSGLTEAVSEQLQGNPSINQIVGSNVNALMLASRLGHKEIALLLLEHGADTALTNSIGKTALAMAAQEGHVDLLNLLIEYGADLHSRTFRGEDALMFAANAGQREAVQFLLHHGADPGRTNRFGQSASYFARQNGYVEVAELLRH